MALNVIETYQVEVLIDKLGQIYPEDLDLQTMQKLKIKLRNSNQNFTTISKEIEDIMAGKQELNFFLKQYQIPTKNQEPSIPQVEQEVKHALNMAEITEFYKDGKVYIKITYRDGRVQMIENRNQKDTKQIFEDVQKLKSLNSQDEIQNAEEAFKELLKDYVEVPLENTTFINQDYLKKEEQSKLNFVEMNFPNSQVLASPQENIFIIKGNPDITVEVTERYGTYALRQLGEASFQAQETSQKEKLITTKTSNEVKQEYSVEELKRLTEGMTEEEIVEYLRLHGQNPQQIMMALLSLEEKKQEEQVVLEPPKQMVLTNNRKKQRMAAFINTIYFAFLVGMISGIIFFGMLRFILKSL